MSATPDVIARVLRQTAQVEPCESVSAWWPRHRVIASEVQSAIDLAIAGGFEADRVGWAFASGYQAALRALVPDLPGDQICALCVTEEEGNSPRAIKSTLKRVDGGWRLDGAKRWTTLGPAGGLFLVAARDADAAGERALLRVARVASNAGGVAVEPMPATRFVPEVPHARLRFEDVRLSENDLLPGDGYDAYVKRFRTVEDIHVHAAVLAYLTREARRLAWPKPWIERALSNLIAMREIARLDAASPATHIALAGALAAGSALMSESEELWRAASTEPAAARWNRDRELLRVASQARELRTARAWERVSAQVGLT
jgi:alkylation response protein AidB-like acyl-CoA dehydrogenase